MKEYYNSRGEKVTNLIGKSTDDNNDPEPKGFKMDKAFDQVKLTDKPKEIGEEIEFVYPDETTRTGKITGRNFSFDVFTGYVVEDSEGRIYHVNPEYRSGWSG